MSLIQEALKRKQDGSSPPEGNLTSKEMTRGPLKKRKERSSDYFPVTVILVGGMGLVFLVILAVLLFWRLPQSVESGTAGQASRDAAIPAATLRPVPSFVPRAEPVVKKVAWPRLTVMGVLTNPESETDSVIVNGKVRDQGETIDGATILRVESKGVMFRFQEETQFVKVGRTYPD